MYSNNRTGLWWTTVTLLVVPNLFVLRNLMHQNGAFEFDISPESCYVIVGICGALAGFSYASIYGPRYYISHIVGYFFGSMIGLKLSCFIYMELVNHAKDASHFSGFLGIFPVFYTLQYLRAAQDIIVPPSQAEKNKNKRIEKELGENIQNIIDENQRRRWRRVRIILCILPPLGFLVNYLWYQNNSGKDRRLAVIGMWMSGVCLVVFLLAYLFACSLGPGDQLGFAANFPAPLAQPGPVARAVKPKEPITDPDTLANKLQYGTKSEKEDAVESLLKVDPKSASKEVVKAVAKGMKALAFDQETDIFTREKAIEGMAKWGGSFSVPYLIEMLGDRNPYYHQACFRELTKLKDPRAIEPVARCYMTEFSDTEALKYLDVFGSEAESALLKNFPPENPTLVKRGLEFLGKYGTKKSMKALEALHSRQDFWIYSAKALDASNAIGKREKERNTKID